MAGEGNLGLVADVPRQHDAGRRTPGGVWEPDIPLAVGQLHILAFAADAGTAAHPHLPERLSAALGGVGDQVAIRVPDVASHPIGTNARIDGVPRIPGVNGPVSPLLRADGMPGDVDILVGYGNAAGIADLRLDAYPDARVVQVLDRVPTDPEHIRLLSRADLVVTVGPDVTAGVRELFAGVPDAPPVHESTPGFTAQPIPPPRGDGPPRVLVPDVDPQSAERAATMVRDLRAQGVDVRLTVTTREPDPEMRHVLQRTLTTTAGAPVTVQPVPDQPPVRTRQLHDADLVIPLRVGEGIAPDAIAAAEHGVPLLVDPDSGAGRFLGDPRTVPPAFGDGSVLRDGSSLADQVRGALADPELRSRALQLRDHLTTRYSPEVTARQLHNAIHALGGDVARVDDRTWQATLDPRDVVLRNAPDPPGGDRHAPDGDRLRVMTACPEWFSTRGGVPTANRELTEAFAAAGPEVHARVSIVDPTDPGRQRLDTADGIAVSGTQPVWGVTDRGQPDIRALMIRLGGLPPDVDVIVGHSRFSGGAATWLADNIYPDAQYVHVLHTSPEVLDALRGDPAQGLMHARTEITLMNRADLVAGVGPLLSQEAARLAAAGRPDNPPPVHQIISDMPRDPADPPPRPHDRQGFEIAVQGRAGDPIKAVEFAAQLIADLRAEGWDVRLTVRGAPSGTADVQAQALSEIAGTPVTVREFTPDRTELLADLHHADLAMMPSLHEGFGLVASEAARAGIPVVVGEGTGAGMFFGDPALVPEELGEPATVRDGITVDVLRDTLLAATGPDGTLSQAQLDDALARIADQRLEAWTAHVRQVLTELPDHRQRALALRDFLDQTFPPGSAARALLAAMSGEQPPLPAQRTPAAIEVAVPTAPGRSAVSAPSIVDDQTRGDA